MLALAHFSRRTLITRGIRRRASGYRSIQTTFKCQYRILMHILVNLSDPKHVIVQGMALKKKEMIKKRKEKEKE